MRRTTSAADGRSETSTELIDRIAAEQGNVTGTGRHRLPAGYAEVGRVEAVITTDPAPKHTLIRRLAPLAVGAVVMLVATVATIAQPADETSLAAPELSNALVRTEPSTAPPPPTTAPPTTDPQATPEPTPTPAPTTRRPSSPSPGGDSPDGDEKAAAAAPRSGGGGEGRQAAAVHSWKHVGGDEFNGGKSPLWSAYDGAGHAGNGRRTPDAISVANGMLVISGDSEGNTGGMSWKEDQRFGRWEMRARFPKGDDQYHPVLILWRESGGKENGEVDFAETTSASNKVSFFLHYGSEQEYTHKTIDISQWHNYAVEWVEGRITGYIDGEKWFESTAEETLPPGRMHPTIQLDYFPEGGSPQPTEMHVDYMRIYR